MKRRIFPGMLGLAALAQAQQWKECTTGVPGTTSYVAPNPDMVCWTQYKKAEPALRDQCPVCGTMAEKYVNPSECLKVSANGTINASNVFAPCGPKERMTRCKRCNAAFWQDAI